VSFFSVEPEVAGAPASDEHAGGVACVFDTWLGDDIVRAHPAVLVTTRAKNALSRLPGPTGFELTKARVTSSRFFRKHSPGRRLPRFWAVEVDGEAGRDDMGLTPSGTLVVSRRVLDVLLGFRIGRAALAQYTVQKRAAR
jgi:hypothetical protein